MYSQRIVEPDIILRQILPSMHFAMNERAVMFMLYQVHLACRIVFGLFYECRNKRVKVFVYLLKNRIQTAHVAEHIITVTEHHIVCYCMVQALIPCGRYASVLAEIVFDLERIAAYQLVRQPYICSVIADDHANLLEVYALLHSYAVKQWLYDLVCLLVLWNKDL